MSPVRWDEGVEEIGEHEEEVITEVIDTMLHTRGQSLEQHRHGTSATHAKSHGVVTGTLTVDAGLPPELAQGLFSDPATYEVVLRYASEPGQLDSDTEKRARGAALKVLDVPGVKLREGWTSQDFLFNTWPVIPQGDVETYLQVIKQRDKHDGHTVATRVGTLLHHPSTTESLFDRTPNINPVAHTYYTQSAFRYGDHIAKLALVPATEPMRAAAERTVSRGDGPGVLAEWVRAWFETQPASYDLCVQLCADLAVMPVEDASVEWSEDISPYRKVATVRLPAQESFSHARRVYAEDVMSWRPWFGLESHRPLGSINRVRRRAYEVLGDWRHQVNARDEADPLTLAAVPG